MHLAFAYKFDYLSYKGKNPVNAYKYMLMKIYRKRKAGKLPAFQHSKQYKLYKLINKQICIWFVGHVEFKFATVHYSIMGDKRFG